MLNTAGHNTWLALAGSPSAGSTAFLDVVVVVVTVVVTVVTVVCVSVFVCTFTFFVIIGALLRLSAKWRTPIGKPEKRPQSAIQNGISISVVW